MAWVQPVEQWFPCLWPEWKDAIEDLIVLFPSTTWVTASLVWDSVAIAYFGGVDSEMDLLFQAVFRVTKTLTGLPFPFDRLYSADAAYWQPMKDYLNTSPDTDMCQCPPVRFIGHKGGAWPDCPP